MRFSEEGLIFLIALVVFPLLFFGGIGFFGLKQNQVFQEAYAKNMECRMAYKTGHSASYIDDACGKIPEYKEFVRHD
jgi:hypothetical protein